MIPKNSIVIGRFLKGIHCTIVAILLIRSFERLTYLSNLGKEHPFLISVGKLIGSIGYLGLGIEIGSLEGVKAGNIKKKLKV